MYSFRSFTDGALADAAVAEDAVVAEAGVALAGQADAVLQAARGNAVETTTI